MQYYLPFITLLLGYFLGYFPYRKLDKCILLTVKETLDKIDKFQTQIANLCNQFADLSVQLINTLKLSTTPVYNTPRNERDLSNENLEDDLDSAMSGGLN